MPVFCHFFMWSNCHEHQSKEQLSKKFEESAKAPTQQDDSSAKSLSNRPATAPESMSTYYYFKSKKGWDIVFLCISDSDEVLWIQSSLYLCGEAQRSLRHPLKNGQAVPFPRVSVHLKSSSPTSLPDSSSSYTIWVRGRRDLARGVGQHLSDAGRIQVDVEVGRDLAALGDVEESEADEERFHLGFSRKICYRLVMTQYICKGVCNLSGFILHRFTVHSSQYTPTHGYTVHCIAIKYLQGYWEW